MDERELRESIRKVGPLLPAAMFNGDEIDGRRRRRICNELGVYIETKFCSSLADACAHLWPLHPARAIELANTRNVTELSQLCGARPAAIAKVLREMRPPARASYLRSPRQMQGQKNVLVQVWMEPQLKFLATRAATREGVNLSAFVREATWYRAQLKDPRAPDPGAERAPKWVKPRERRNLSQPKRARAR